MATTFEVIFLGTLSKIDPTQDNEVAENASGILGTYGTSSAPLSSRVVTLSADRLSEDANDSYDTDNGGGFDSFKINGGASQNFDATATYNAVITYADGTTASVTATLFQDVNGNTYLVPEETNNADQAALTAKPIQSLQLNSVVSASGDGWADRIAGDFKASVDGTAGNDSMGVGYTDAQGDQITNSNDHVSAGAGNDTVSAGGGNDVISGGDGNDTVTGGDGNDLYYGGAGDDRFGDWNTDGGNDTAYGGDGADTLIGAGNDDVIYGDAGNDVLSGGVGIDSVYGGTGNDQFWVSEDHQIDSLFGGEENADYDRVDFGNWLSTDGVTVTYTGTEAGTYDYNGSGDASGTFSGMEGVSGTNYADTINASSTTTANEITGNGGADALTGGSGDDTFFGGTGNDTVVAGLGSDVVYGGDGGDVIYTGNASGAVTGTTADSIYAGAGDDHIRITEIGWGASTIDGGDGTDTIFFEYDPAALGGTTLRIVMSDTTTQPLDGVAGDQYFSNVENVTTGSGTDSVVGNSSANIISTADGNDTLGGGAGNDSLYAGQGNDVLRGDSGSDLLAGGAGTDTADYAASASGVTVNLTTGAGSGGNAAGDTLSGIENVIGSAQADSLTGDGTANVLDGGAGDDLIDVSSADNAADIAYGGDGDDTLTSRIDLDGGNDTLFGGAGRDVLVAGAGDSVDGGSTGDDFDTLDLSSTPYVGATITLTGSGEGSATSTGQTLSFTEIEAITGTAQADTINATADGGGMQLSGGGGNDSVTGGSGNDVLFGGSGTDTLTGADGIDHLSGGDGNDLLQGGAGTDTLIGDEGNDILTGGAGDDRYRFETGSGFDVITDFDLNDDDNDGFTNDQFDVSDLTNPDGSSVRVFDITVTDDGFGNAVLNFAGGEKITLQGVSPAQARAPGQLHAAGIPCFTPGALIETDLGPVRVERLRPGNRVRTLDHGYQPVRWVGCRRLDTAELTAFPNLRPVVIRKGAVGNSRRMLVSPQHGFLVGGQLIRAKHLAASWGGKVARVDRSANTVTYVHFLCDRHEIVFAEGAATESLYPGPQALRALARHALTEVLTLFPDLAAGMVLRDSVEATYGPPARVYRKPPIARSRKGALRDMSTTP